MENLENSQIKKNQEQGSDTPEKITGTNDWQRIRNSDGSVSAFKTKEELDEHIKDLRDSSKTK